MPPIAYVGKVKVRQSQCGILSWSLNSGKPKFFKLSKKVLPIHCIGQTVGDVTLGRSNRGKAREKERKLFAQKNVT